MRPALSGIFGKDGVTPRRLFFWLLPFLLAFRLWLATVLPITGDEAYFIWWGKIPDWGFYDHPPMIGWWLAAQLLLGDGAGWLRLTSVLQPFALAVAVAWFVPRLWPGADENRRWWAALLCLLSPAFVWNVLITTDTPLIYFSVLSGLCWLRARRELAEDGLGWYLAAGVLLAGAVLSKYFVVFLGFAYLLDLLLRPTRKGWLGLVTAYACCVPGLALMAWWNAGHCWPNYMFNFVNRHGDAALGWKNSAIYGLMMVYLLTPAGVWGLMRSTVIPAKAGIQRGRQRLDSRFRGNDDTTKTFRSLVLVAFIPLLMFALLSLEKTIGLHWVLSFLPFCGLLLALHLPETSLRRTGLFFLGFALLHVAFLVWMSFTQLEDWKKTNWYESAVLAFEAKAIAERLKPYEADYAFASNGYADAVTLGYNARRYFLVFGEASSHARHDDILTDFRALDGKNILILRKSAPSPGEYEPYFRELHTETFVLHGVTFYSIFGQGFDYVRYREKVLAVVNDKYYRIPGKLPRTACYFFDRYGFSVR
ncbi:MAG: phospholipid carrier-dependent glycosyltransferase [Rhodocyclaceae bacterium]|nr:MAG: phospholipid carrier-dependent glycosyltransferase [Rhodocyclaceae bacterium]